jgi:hypothetical protein
MGQKNLSISIFFDGTGNNKNHDTASGKDTNVAKLYEMSQANKVDLSYHSPWERKSYSQNANNKRQSESLYFDGVGSKNNLSNIRLLAKAYNWLQKGMGIGANKRIEQAYNAVVLFYNKNPGEKVDINLIGFSRGSAQARSLSNRLIKRGIPKLDAAGKKTGKFIQDPGETRIKNMGLFDTVASFGVATIDTHIGKDLQIHKNVEQTIHLVALNEYRKTFALTSALSKTNPRVKEIGMPGAHSQIGGGYKNDPLSAGSLNIMWKNLTNNGMKLREYSEQDKKNLQIYKALLLNPDKLSETIRDSRIAINGKTFLLEKKQKHRFQRPVKARRIVYELDNSLSKVSTVQKLLRQSLGEKMRLVTKENSRLLPNARKLNYAMSQAKPDKKFLREVIPSVIQEMREGMNNNARKTRPGRVHNIIKQIKSQQQSPRKIVEMDR